MQLTKDNITELHETSNSSFLTFRVAFRRIIHNKKPEQDQAYITILNDSLKRLTELVRFLELKYDKSGVEKI